MLCFLSLPSKMKTDLELALECAINIYHHYAIKNPLDDYLSKAEFSQLLRDTAQPFLHRTAPVRAQHSLGRPRASQRGGRGLLGFS